MAYNSKNETLEVLKDINVTKNGIIRVAKVTNSKGTSFDIRRMYKDEDGQDVYTVKGIRIGSGENIENVIVAIMKNLDEDTYNKIIDELNKE